MVVLATTGIEANPAQFLLDALDQKRGALPSTDTNRGPALELAGQTLLAEFEEMIQGAQNARVTFYSLSPVVRPPAQGSRGHLGCRVELRWRPAARQRTCGGRREHRAPDRCHRRRLVHDLE